MSKSPSHHNQSHSMNVKKLYMREHSNVVRKWSSKQGVDGMHENPVFPLDGIQRVIMVTICRIRQRILSQAWQYLVENTGVKHDYEADARQILTRKIPDDELRSELEVEVLYKWVLQAKDIDPTGVANTIFMSKKKAAKYAALQQMRLEFYEPGDTVLFQGDIPRPEDGHFTVLDGECDVLQFPDESVPLMKLQYIAKKKKWDDAKKLLRSAQVVAKIPKYSGFGELSTLTGVKRAASIRASNKAVKPVEIIVLPKVALLDCLKSRSQDDASTSEAIDFLRQSGLANRISPKDLVQAARSMLRRTMLQGDILFYKGEPAKSMFLVVSGEFLLDIGDFMVDGKPLAFVSNSADTCYYLSTGSLLGDEGAVGEDKVFASTAVVVSTAAVVFEATGFGLSFLAEKLKSLRYCALYYKDKLRWDNPNGLVEQVNPYTYFNSLRKTIAFTNPFRGVMSIAEESIAHLNDRKLIATLTGKPCTVGRKSNNHADEERFLKSRSRKVKQIDSRASFLMLSMNKASIAESLELAVEEPSPFKDYPRVLTGLGLHRAIEINKLAKKALQNSMKAHAKESILYEQLRKIPEAEQMDSEKLRSMQLFKKGLKDYYRREEERVRKLRAEEEAKRNANSRASTAIKFFASTFEDGEFDEPMDGEAGEGEKIVIKNLGDEASAAPGTAAKAADASTTNLPEGMAHDDSSLESMKPDPEPGSVYDIYEGHRDLTRLQQYFEWMDSLNRTHYRGIVAQAKQTADMLQFQQHHDLSKSILNEAPTGDAALKHIQELSEVFRSFGLSPQDLNIPWQFSEQAPALKRAGSSRAPSSQLSIPLGLGQTTPTDLSRSATPDPTRRRRNAAVPVLNVPSTTSPTSKASPPRGSVLVMRSGAAETEDLIAKARLESQYKSYNPASWRDELIMKKAQELTGNAYRFVRSTTPDNRRVLFVRINHFRIEPYNPDHHRADGSSRKEKLLYATIKGKTETRELDGLDFEEYIDSPEYFMEMLGTEEVGPSGRKLPPVDAWRTRYLVSSANNQAKSRPPVLDSVRTHLKEDLQAYRKDALIDEVHKLVEEVHSRPLIQTFCDDDQQGSAEHKPQQTVPVLLRRNSTMSAMSEPGTSIVGMTDYHPGALPRGVDLEESHSIVSRGQDSVGYLLEISQSLPAVSNHDSLGRRPSVAELKIPSVEEMQQALEGSAAAEIQATPTPQTTTKITPKRRASINLAAESLASNSTDTGPPPRITDAKPASKALALFEDYQRIYGQGSKAQAEGRKKANQNSKFRLQKAQQDTLGEVSLVDINQQRWKAEWTLFHAMFPQCTQKNQAAFIEAFRRRYPDATITPDIRVVPPESITLNYPSAQSYDELSVESDPAAGITLAPPSPKSPQLAHSQFSSADLGSQSQSTTTAVEDPELESWQKYTVEKIVQTKDGERKTLPEVSVKSLNINGKRYRTATGAKTFVPLVKLPAKKDEEPINGPTSYLTLYKKGFQVHLTSTEKQRALQEIKQYRNHK